MYKNKEKQREANRVSASKSRLKRIAIQKGMTQGRTERQDAPNNIPCTTGGVTQGMTAGMTEKLTTGQGITLGVTNKDLPWYDRVGEAVADAVTYPDIIDKLTDPFWRSKLEKIHAAFQSSHNPGYAKNTFLGVIPPERYPLDVVFDYLEVTR